MKFSIHTVVKNRAIVVARCCESIKKQVDVEVEHIVQDGCSTDDTVEIVLRCSPGAHVKSEVDAGLYDALNKSLRRGSGEIEGILHSDDVFADEYVLRDVERLFEDPYVDADYGDIAHVRCNDGRRIFRDWRSGPFRPWRLKLGWMPPHPTLFLRANLAREMSFDTDFSISGDYGALLKLLVKSAPPKVAYLPRTIV